jgi:hypothetical protein
MKRYIITLFVFVGLSVLFSCHEEEFEQATVTFHPTLYATLSEPEVGVGQSSTITVKTSRVMTETSQVNVKIKGNGAGYGYSYVTNPPQLEQGIVTVSILKGENSGSFTFAPKSDGIAECTGYNYELEIVGASKFIKSIGQSVFSMFVADNSPGIFDFDFEDCNSSPVGLTEVKPAGSNVMQANTWGCTSFGYPSETTRALEANAFGKGAGTSNAYAVTDSVDMTELTGLCISGFVYSHFSGAGEINFLYSTNYSGDGDPEAEGVVWTEISAINSAMPAAGSRAWKSVNAILTDLPATKVYIAIQYKGGTATSASNWRVDDLKIKGI